MKQDRYLFYGVIVFFMTAITAAGYFAGKQVTKEKDACVQQGGEPVVIRSQVFCFAPGALKGTP